MENAPAIVAGTMLVVLYLPLHRAWKNHLGRGAWSLLLPLAAVAWHGYRLTPASFSAAAQRLASVRVDPYLLWETPGAALVPGVAWPLGRLFGDQAAVSAIGLFASGLSVLLIYPLTRSAGFGAGLAVVSQCLFVLGPASWAAVGLGLLPALVEQSLSLLLVVHLARRIPHLDGALDAFAAFTFLALAEMWGLSALSQTSILVFCLVATEALFGQGRRCLRLLAAWSFATAGSALLHRGAIAALLKHGIPVPVGGFWPTLAWLGPLPLVLAVPGLTGFRFSPAHVRRVLAAAVFAGAVRTAWVADGALSVAGPLAPVAAAGLYRLWRGEIKQAPGPR